MVDLSRLERQRLVAVTAALFTDESDVSEVFEVWLHLESATVEVRVAADWTLRITPDEPGESYVMPEFGSRVDVVRAPDEVPFTRHVGERLVRVIERFDVEAFGQCMEAEFVFGTGNVVAWSFGGDLHLADR
ncbi:hypothetical protein [Streptosporangium carneum]|uniref:Uncharacterized protein n=1 Tax=Streptosporangium carneum TaxID=47481 RepID=A0A9W6HWR6_9ACTN|nr:hypothetical protein [Streptosporangium carneum]GLK07428.1 hypothetical protein GCM10017600_08330 [Streptosporangium carneum]